MATGKTIPPRGKTGWSPAANRQFWKARTNDSNDSKEAGVTSLQNAYSTGGENSHWEAWLNSDGEGESGINKQSPLSFGEEKQEVQQDQEDPPQAPTQSSASALQKRIIHPDARPWLLKLSPQWIDFKRRRSSLLSLHYSNGSRIPSSFSGFSSEIDGSKSSIEVHNFLEESAGSDEGGSLDGAEVVRGNGSSYRGGIGDGRNDSGSGNDLDAQDIRFLSDGKKLRDVLLAIEDLHFSELPLTRQVELMRGLTVVHVSSGEVIFRQGDLSETLYFMLGPSTDPEADGHDDEYILLTTETNEKVDEPEGGGGDEPKWELPFIPSQRFFGEEGLIYSKDYRRSCTVRAAVGLSLAVLHWPAFPHWWDFRLYLLMKKVSLLAKLPCRAQTAVLHALQYADYDPGELIIREGETGDKFYMITRGTVTVTTMTADSLGSIYSSSASSSAVDDDDNENLSDPIDFMAEFSSPIAIADDEDRLSDGGCDSRDERRYTDAFEGMFLTPKGTAAQQQRTAAAGAPARVTNTARIEPPQGGAQPQSGSAIMDANRKGDEEEEIRVAQDPPSQTDSQEHGGRGRWSGIDSTHTEKVLTRLYEGHSFGEMSLIYDEPRNASVRAVTEVTCLYLHKDDFRKCLCDKTFDSLMQQAALQTACYREKKALISGHHHHHHHHHHRHHLHHHEQQHSARMGTESPTNFASVRATAAVRGGGRSSFRATKQLTFAGDATGETNGRVINDYRVCEKVGEGSFGAVYKVVHTHSGETYAMKVITKPKRGGQKREHLERSLRREVSVMQMLKHPNVVTLWEVIDNPRSRKVYMIQEFMEGGALFKEKYAVEPLPEHIAISKFVQAARGLQYIHSFGICHGDIKPSNILEDAAGTGGDGDISSGGNSVESLNDIARDRDRRKHRRKKRGQRVGGTPSFHPPELFGEGGVSRISFASDLWALGVTLYQMIVGKMPFFGRTYRALMASIKLETLTFPSECQIEPYLVNLLHRMLDKNPKTRITLEEALNHEWVTKEGVCPDGEIEIPGRDRRLSEAQRGTPHVAAARDENTQPRAAILRRVGATSSEGASAGAGARSTARKNMRNSISGASRNDDTTSATGRRRQFSLPAETEISMGGGDKNAVRVPSTLPSKTSISGSRSNRFSSLSPGAPVGEEPGHQQRWQQLKQEQTLHDGARGGKAEPGYHRRFCQEAAAKRKTNMNVEKEVQGGDEDEETSMWSDDKIPSPRILEDIVDNCHLYIPPGMALHALTVTLPEKNEVASAASGGSGSSGGSSGIGPTGSKLSTTWSSVPPRSTLQNEEDGGVGGRGSGKYRSVCSCPAMGATDASPLLGRNELTDRIKSTKAALMSSANTHGRGAARSSALATVKKSAAESACDRDRLVKTTTHDGGVAEAGGGGELWVDGGSSCGESRRESAGSRRGSGALGGGRSSCGESWRGSNIESVFANSSDTDPSESSFRTGAKLFTSVIVGRDDDEDRKHATGGADRTLDSLEWGSDCSRGQVACHIDGERVSADDTGEPAAHKRKTSSRLTLFAGVDEGMGCIEEEPEQLDTTSYFESSGAESGNYGTERWRSGAIPATELVGTAFKGIDTQGTGGASGANDVAGGEAGAGVAGEIRCTKLILGSEGDGEDIGEESSENDSSSDGIGESASVADITDCLEFIGEVNIDVGVRFGVSLDQGKRCSMEDTTTCLTDAFSVDSRGDEVSSSSHHNNTDSRKDSEVPPEERSLQLAAMTRVTGADPSAYMAATEAGTAANAAVNATATTTAIFGEAPEAAAYFGLFDGHGGADVAVRLQDFLHLRVLNNPHFPSDIPQDVGKTAFAATSLKRQKTEQVFSGAVAVIAIIHRPPASPAGTIPDQSPQQLCSTGGAAHRPQNHPQQNGSHSRTSSTSSTSSCRCLKKRPHRQPVFLHVANVGDCRAVLCRGGNAVAITTDHTPSVPSEAARVEAAGGFVYPPREGNGLWDEQQVISEPAVHSIELTAADNFLILACDGVWDVLSNQEAVSYVHRRLLTHRDVQRAAVELIDKHLYAAGQSPLKSSYG
eukprot:g1534.t1